MARKILAILAGLISGIVAISLLELLGHSLFMPPETVLSSAAAGQDESFFELVSSTMMMAVLGAYILGSFIAGLVCVLIGKKTELSVIVGALLTIAGVINLSMLPHPIWFVAGSLIVYAKKQSKAPSRNFNKSLTNSNSGFLKRALGKSLPFGSKRMGQQKTSKHCA